MHKLQLKYTKYKGIQSADVEIISIFVGGIFMGSPCNFNVGKMCASLKSKSFLLIDLFYIVETSSNIPFI